MSFGFTTTCNKNDVWHYRLGHLSNTTLNILNKKFPDICISTDFLCDICPRFNQKRLSFSKSISTTMHAFDLVHVDIWGPTVLSLDGYRYFVTFVDDYTTWTVMIKKTKQKQHRWLKFFMLWLKISLTNALKSLG